MANAYIRNSVLSDEQVLVIMRGYAHFVSPKDIAAQVGVSRQTTHNLYLKFSQRLHAARAWQREGQDAARRDLHQWLEGREVQSAYSAYRDGPALEDYRVGRQGRMLSPEEYGPYVVARELRERWGKISERAFVFHYALILRTVEYRTNWMQLLGTGDLVASSIVRIAAQQMYEDLERSLRLPPFGRTAS